MKALTTVSAPSAAPKQLTMTSQSGSVVLWPFVPSSEKPAKVPFTKCSPTPDDASRTTRHTTTLSSSPTHPLPPVAFPTITSHPRRTYMSPNKAPPPFFRSYPSRGTIVPTLSTLPHHSGSLLSQQSPGMLASKGERVNGLTSAEVTMVRNTTNLNMLNTNILPPTSFAGAKRRLGMGHSGAGIRQQKEEDHELMEHIPKANKLVLWDRIPPIPCSTIC
jgi:hypothetical protein